MAQGLYDIAALEPLIDEGYSILTPNLRLSRRIKSQWDKAQAAAGRTVWESLAVLPLEDWLLQRWQEAVRCELLPALVPLSQVQEHVIWQQVIVEQGNQAGGFSLIRDTSAAELASGARDTMLRWELGMADPAIRQQFQLEQDCDAFLIWLDLFEARLAADGLCTRAQCLAALAQVGDELEPANVVLVECEDLPPATQRCLRVLTSQVERQSVAATEVQAQVHPYADQRSQLQGVASWAAQIHRDNPAATIGIVLTADKEQRTGLEYLLRREFGALGADYNSLPVNFSSGITLAQAPVVRDALAVLSCGLQYIAVAEVAKFFQSRFVDLPDRDSALAQYFLVQLHQGGSEQVEVAQLRNFAGTVKHGEQVGLSLGARLLDMSGRRELRGTCAPSQWSDRFGEVLALWGWPGSEPLDSLEYQQVTRWYKTLDEFRALDAACPALDYAAALALLRDVCNRQVSHPQTADSAVQVLGPLEAVGLSFDHLWVCGMQAANWPASPRPNPFIPAAMQAIRQMPHATVEREWAFAQALLHQYAGANRELHASYCTQVDGVPDLPSPLLAGLAATSVPEDCVVDPLWYEQRAAARCERVEDDSAPPIGDERLTAIRGGAALLEHQSHCPFRAFARHRLAVDALPEFGVGLSAAERGNIVHEALRVLWHALADHASLVAMGDNSKLQAVQQAVAVAIETPPGFRRRALGRACLELEGQRLEALLMEWLAVESSRGEFAIAALESGVELTLSRLTVRLRVDRSDRLPDGSSVIIDYKTGKARAADWFGERPAKPQLLLYGLAADGPPAALAFAQLRADECEYVGVGEVGDIPGVKTDIAKLAGAESGIDDWAALNARWAEQLNLLANEFLGGVARVDPLAPGSCTYCGLQSLCRIEDDDPEQQEVQQEVQKPGKKAGQEKVQQ